jgi:UDP-N-acetylglucosamine 1-carboxyvinyltransferase
MQSIRLHGNIPLHGTIPISGAKNAALPLMAAALLSASPLVLQNVPHLADISTMGRLLSQHGVRLQTGMEGSRQTLTLHAETIASTTAPYDLVRTMRASVLVLGPLLAREGQAKVSLPGGCAIGTRPVDLHLMGLEKMGATIRLESGYIHAEAPTNGLQGATIALPHVSVGATENLLMAASLASGETVLRNAAREPEITDLANCLVAMGAQIRGIGTDTLTIQGVSRLHGATHRVIADRIETGTYMIAAAITGGELTLQDANLEDLQSFADTLRQTGVRIRGEGDTIIVNGEEPLTGVDVMTEPYPGFPTDLQAQYLALMTVAGGAAMITETIFENRFMHVPELCRMGARVTVHQSSAMVRGVRHLTGAPLMATDLRASSSLVLAGLAAKGETLVNRVYHLDRGYERLEEKLSACGARIERLRQDEAA